MKLNASALPVWYWNPGGFLENFWFSVYIGVLAKLGLILGTATEEETNLFASQSEGKQAKSEASSSLSFFVGHH